MAEGRTKKYYKSDTITVFDNTGAGQPAQFFEHVPNNLAAQAALGWSAADATLPVGLMFPRRFKPRHAVGVSPAGKRVRVIVADLAADLWTGAANTWDYIDNFGATITATVTGRVGEHGSS